MPVPNKRFFELLQDIEPSRTTKSRAARAHSAVRDHLRTHGRFQSRYVSSYLSGSYARDTSIRPRTTDDGQERPDIDIIIVTNFTADDRPDDVLREVANALSNGGRGYKVERINKRSVRVETSQVEMDIVPVFEMLNGYMIADRETNSWLFTNPPVHTNWSVRQNDLFDGRFKSLVKMFKWWRRINPTSSKRPKGFVLEVLMSVHGPCEETHYGEAFTRALENIRDAYTFGTQVTRKPFIADPAVSGNDILARVTEPQWGAFIDKARVYASIARRAQDAEDMDEATRQWRRVFGDRFKPTVETAKADAYGGLATAAPAPYGRTFPDAQADPRDKPRGFA